MNDEMYQFVLYLIQHAKRRIGKTDLLKLVYLADVEYVRRTGQQLTRATWKRDSFGPVDYHTVSDSATHLRDRGLITIEVNERMSGDDTHQYVPIPGTSMELSEEWKQTADFVIERYSHLSLPQIKDVAYHTEPMLPGPSRGEELDMSLIERYDAPVAVLAEHDPVMPGPLSDGEREHILRSVMSSQELEGHNLPRSTVSRLLDEALSKPLPDIG